MCLTKRAKDWPVFLCVLHLESRVSVRYCVSYTECHLLVCVIVCVTLRGICWSVILSVL